MLEAIKQALFVRSVEMLIIKEKKTCDNERIKIEETKITLSWNSSGPVLRSDKAMSYLFLLCVSMYIYK